MVKSPRLTWPMIPDDLDVEPHSDQPSRQRPAPVNIWNAPSQQKKPRHRHSPAAIAALNELYDRDEHPALELRTSLAKRLGMEVKTVNAWFQNKRASSKKQRSRGGVPSQRTSRGKGPNTPQDLHKYDDDLEDEDDYSRANSPYSLNNSSVSITGSDNPSQTVSPTFYAGNPDHTHFLVEPTDMPRKMRNRPTAEQTEELRKLYNQNPHPSTEQRQMLAERINMRYQSITNWFQNQRSLAKKRREDDGDVSTDSPSNSRESWPEPNRTFAAFPPPSSHPSLHLPPPSTHPSLGLPSASAPPSRRSVSVTPSIIGDEPSPAKRSRRSGTPYSSTAPSSRPRRTRPEPYQLHALKELSAKTINPSIEARTALALEIGMDLGKVTNWFRNLRQTARKRASKKMGSGDDDYEDNDTEGYIALSLPSASVSRANSPFITSSSSSSHDVDEPMDVDHHHRSEPRRRRVIRALSEFDMGTPSQQASDDGASDEDFEEAVTPSPDPSPSPPSPTNIPMPMPISMPMQLPSPPSHGHTHAHVDLRMVIDQTYPSEMDNKSAHSSNVTIEDALLLLSFHQRAVH